MSSHRSLSYYIECFRHLRRAPGTCWTELTKRQAPHKPMLLMAVMDLVAKRAISSSFFDIETNLVDLNDLFTAYWRRTAPIGKMSSIAFPFSRLHSEPFWKLLWRPDVLVSPPAVDGINNVTRLRKYALGARIDDDLFAFMAAPESRFELRNALLESCFSENGRQLMIDQASINEESFDYGAELLRRAHASVSVEEPAALPKEARTQGFRRVVIRSYDHRCALCGVRIITPEGHTVVDAAHIVPWSESRNDDIRNGMALCKICHWAFDEGMMGISDDYRVLTSKRISDARNAPGFLTTLEGRGIITPADRDLWPGTVYLKKHRQRLRL